MLGFCKVGSDQFSTHSLARDVNVKEEGGIDFLKGGPDEKYTRWASEKRQLISSIQPNIIIEIAHSFFFTVLEKLPHGNLRTDKSF